MEHEANLEAVLQLKFSAAGQELIKFLKALIHEDVIKLTTQTSAENVAEMAALQGQIIRTQAIVHLLEAEIESEDEETGESN